MRTLDRRVFAYSTAIYVQLHVPQESVGCVHTPASTLVMSSTLMPANGNELVPEAGVAKHLFGAGVGYATRRGHDRLTSRNERDRDINLAMEGRSAL